MIKLNVREKTAKYRAGFGSEQQLILEQETK